MTTLARTCGRDLGYQGTDASVLQSGLDHRTLLAIARTPGVLQRNLQANTGVKVRLVEPQRKM